MIDPPVALVLAVAAGLLLVAWKLLERQHFYALLLSSTLCFMLAECGARAFDIGNPAIAEWIKSREKERDYPYQPGTQLIYRYPDNPRGYFNADNEVTGQINGLGYRGVERGFTKPEGVTRIVMLGDSITLGMGVRDEDTLPAQLEQELANEDSKVEVINLGRTTSSTRYQIKLLRTYGLSFDPDLIVVAFFLNDIEGPGGVDSIQRPPVLKKVRNHSHFINAIISSIENRIMHGRVIRHYEQGYAEDSPALETVRSALLRGRSMADKHGAQFVVAIYPKLVQLQDYPFGEAHDKITTFCNTQGIPVLDLLDAFSNHTDRELWVHRTDRHPNEMTHSIAAAHLANFLRRERLLP